MTYVRKKNPIQCAKMLDDDEQILLFTQSVHMNTLWELIISSVNVAEQTHT